MTEEQLSIKVQIAERFYPLKIKRQDEEKIQISLETTGGITGDVTGAETFGTIVSLAESFVQQGLFFKDPQRPDRFAPPANPEDLI